MTVSECPPRSNSESATPRVGSGIRVRRMAVMMRSVSVVAVALAVAVAVAVVNAVVVAVVVAVAVAVVDEADE
jgi:hypothetical protein